ncbi:Uncharacterized protein PECH_008411 [Penicillium ucsense]|uniref:Uncharacterized protein n=1 Tax=Penicillium ucsense TaxID=2839758 RepID=A0A8J8WGW5_9EURO|nr:Uncharacterized protein PECM_008221 [Penicillium ucsense]KAF7734171.1 Uncharacterized protein PECH_008411 [Penicillium ucsense]
MNFTSILAIATSMLAMQGSAQFIRKPHSSSQSADFQPSRDTYDIPQGGLAPVDPLQPGSDVAPVLIGKPQGHDEGNAFCLGQCFAERSQAMCEKAFAEPMFKASNNCWVCCITAGDF